MPYKGWRSTHCKKGHEFTPENTKIRVDNRRGTARACRECFRAQRRKTRKYDRQKSRESSLRKLYGLTKETFNALLARQNNCCALCTIQFTSTPHIDHDRTCCNKVGSCGKCIRGLLCRNCNVGIGMLRDSPILLEKAVTYIRASNDTT